MMELRFAIYSQWYLVFLSNDERFTLCHVPLLFFLSLEYIGKKTIYSAQSQSILLYKLHGRKKTKKFQTIQEKKQRLSIVYKRKALKLLTKCGCLRQWMNKNNG